MFSLSEQIDAALRISLPYILMFVLFLLGMVSFSMPLSTNIEIPFVFMIIYYWSVYRPSVFPPLLIFIIGVIFDLLSSIPIGITPLILLVLHKVVSGQRLIIMQQPFIVIWLGYFVVSSLGFIIQWLLFGLLNLHWTPFFPIVLTVMAGVFLFPAIAFILSISNRLLPSATDLYGTVK